MTLARGLSLTAAEQQRVEQIDHLVALGASSVDDLLGLLGDPSWTVRRAAVGALASLGDDVAVPLCAWLREKRTSEAAIAAAVDALSASIGPTVTSAVVALLVESDPAVVADAAAILGRRRASSAVPDLTKLLAHTDDNVAVAAIEALGSIGGSAAVEALIRVVGGRQFFRTFPALQVMAKIDDARVVAPIAELLTDPMFRVEAARALGRTGSPLAVPLLATLLTGGEQQDVLLVASALSDLLERATWTGAAARVGLTIKSSISPASRFLQVLPAADPAERVAIARVLGKIGDSTTLPAVVALLDDPIVRAAATEAIEQISVLHTDALVEALERGTSATRIALLPVVRTSRAASCVRGLLSDDEPEVRARACEALGRLGDTSAVPSLFAVLDDPSPRVTHAATSALHSLGSAATPVLALQALASTRTNRRRHALRIIAYLGFREAFDAVRAAVEDPDSRISELAVGALAALDDPRVEGILRELARRPEEPLRGAVMRAAAHRGGDVMGDILVQGLADEAPWVRYYACQGLGRVGRNSSSAALIARLADEVPHVRIAAIEALARLDTPQAWQALAASARSLDPDEQRAALVGISHQPRPAALQFLIDAADSPDVATRLIALAGLARSTDPRSLLPLVAAARGDVIELRDAAISLLADRTDRAAADALVDAALVSDREHPVHRALSKPAGPWVAAIRARLEHASDQAAPLLVAALARVNAIEALFAALTAPSSAARRSAATALVAIDAEGAREAVATLSTTDPDPDVRSACRAAVEA